MKARLPQGYQNSAPNMNQMVRKAQKMQEDIGKIQEELAVKEFTKQVLIFYSENQAGGSGEWSCYEGSYVEVGGKRISDVKQIMPCIIETLEEAERVEKLAQERVEEICRSEKEIEEKELLVSE